MNGKLPLVTVIISCYNHEPYIEESIKSVLAQDYPHLELLVIDDGSSDDSVARIRPLAEAHGFDFHVQPNQGLTKTYNEALARARGSLIVFFGSDDVMLPGRITAQVAYLAEHPRTGVVGGNSEFIDSNGHPLPDDRQNQRDVGSQCLGFDDIFIPRKSLVPQIVTQMFRKSVLDEAGGFNPDIRLEDLYIQFKITRAGHTIDRMPMLLARYRMHPSNSYKNTRMMIESFLATYADYADHPAYEKVRARLLNSWFLKAAGKDRALARELLAQIPLRRWNLKTLRGLLRIARGGLS
ncbi:MAG: glycosyltransferase [Zoogloeaceae bacterium]|nr:glycosyltransferase [Zoogloeaceae bacterium]